MVVDLSGATVTLWQASVRQTRQDLRLIRAFVLWLALLYAVLLVAYVTVVPWLVHLATRFRPRR